MAKKKISSGPATGNSNKNARFVVCPYTDQRVFVAKATLQDLKHLSSNSSTNNSKGPKRLWTIASAQTRHEHYSLVAQAIANVEQDLLPSYGGRSWEVLVALSEPNGRVLFRQYKGKMELAVLPHLLERIPQPPAWPGKRCGQPPDQYVAMQGEVAEAVARRKEFHAEQGYIFNLMTREVSTLSTVAFEILRGHPHSHPIPQVTTKWKSPDARAFTSRKSAWEYAETLSQQEVLINRNLSGIGASGKLLQVFTPSPKTTLEVGRMRFLRDGLWVVGQELAWQESRPAEWQLQQQEQESQSKVFKSGLQLYLATHRHAFKDEHGVTLAQADKNLRIQWRRLSPQEQHVWNDKVQDQMEGSSDGESAGMSEEKEENEKVEYISPLLFFVQKRRHDYRYERQMELNADKFTLTQADRELRSQWREMSEEERDEWIVKLEGDVEEVDGKNEKDSEKGETKNDDVDQVDTEITVSSSSGQELKSAELDNDLIGAAENPEKSASSSPASSDNKVGGNIISSRKIREEKKNDDYDDVISESHVDIASHNNKRIDVVTSSNATSVSPATVSDSTASLPSPRAHQPKSRFTNRWCMKPKQISLCHDACMEHFETVMRTVKNRELARELTDGFDVLRERGRGRFDMELPAFDTKSFDFLNDFKKTPWMPVVRAILGQDVVLIHKGCFLSLPGAGAQEYHQDGVHLNKQSQQPCHAINVFIPLVDLKTKNGPTEFVLGSHVLGHEGYDRDFLETPKPEAGTPVIFDYRLGHRGLANSSHSCRPVVYCTYARAADGKEFRDQVNFSRKRYHKIGELSMKPLSRDERRNKRKRWVDAKEEAELQQALELSSETVLCETACSDNGATITTIKEIQNEKSTDAWVRKKSKGFVKPVEHVVSNNMCEEYCDPVPLDSKKQLPYTSKVQDVVTESIPRLSH
jgi:hypothetical protein